MAEIRSVVKLRTGRKVGRTIYEQKGDEPSDEDVLVGMMDTPELAAFAVAAVNRQGVDPSVWDPSPSGGEIRWNPFPSGGSVLPSSD